MALNNDSSVRVERILLGSPAVSLQLPDGRGGILEGFLVENYSKIFPHYDDSPPRALLPAWHSITPANLASFRRTLQYGYSTTIGGQRAGLHLIDAVPEELWLT